MSFRPVSPPPPPEATALSAAAEARSSLSVIQSSVIVPTWCEARNIRLLVPRIASALRGTAYEVVVVDDRSPDGTGEAARSLVMEGYPVRVIQRDGPRGLAPAVLAGCAAARGAHIAVMDADLQHDANVLPILLYALQRHEIAVATRYGTAMGARPVGRS